MNRTTSHHEEEEDAGDNNDDGRREGGGCADGRGGQGGGQGRGGGSGRNGDAVVRKIQVQQERRRKDLRGISIQGRHAALLLLRSGRMTTRYAADNAIVMAAGGKTLSTEAMDDATATQWQRRWKVRR